MPRRNHDINLAIVQRAKKALEKLKNPAQQNKGRMSLREVITVMYDEIDEQFRRGQTPRQVAEALTARGIPIAMATLEGYYTDERRKRAKEGAK